MMSENKFPPKLWGECILTAAYLKDRTPTRTLKDKTPYEAYYGIRPDVSHLREIGSRAFIFIQAEKNPKIYNRSMEGILIGYSPNSKAYRCYYPKTGQIIVTRNVFFIESKDNHPRTYRPGVQVGDAGEADDPEDQSGWIEIKPIIKMGGKLKCQMKTTHRYQRQFQICVDQAVFQNLLQPVLQ